MNVFHSVDDTLDDMRARAIVEEYRAAVEAQGGTIESPNAPVQPPARIVLHLPEGVDLHNVIPDIEFTEVLVEE